MVERIRGDWLLTDPRSDLIADGVIDVEADQVRWVGPASEAPPIDGVPSVTETTVNGLLMPGLVNAHCHTPMVLLRGAGEGLPLDRWLSEVMWPREGRLVPDDVYWGMKLGSAELLQGGVTTSVEMYFHPAEVAKGAVEAGLRSIVAVPLIEGNPAFGTVEAQLEDGAEFAQRWATDPQIEAALGPHSVYALSRTALEQVAAAAQSTGMLAHIHVAEEPTENDACRSRHGMAVVPLLAAVGLLDVRMLAAHGVWLDAEDRERLAAAQAGVVHCPGSNLRHGNGIADVAALRRDGIAVGLGTDGPASAPRLDMFAEMRLALGLSRGISLDAQSLQVRDVVAMATTVGADLLGRPDLGQLAPGCRADLISIDVNSSVLEPIIEPEDLVTHVVWGAGPAHVSDVWVAGQRVVRDGQITTIDLAEARAEVQQRAVRLAAL